ncbi:MAG: dephospho-CoA kinase [Clostridia bacterium]
MYKVGITGGIATGKSTVANYLIEKGLPVIDCDKLAKKALEKDTAAYKSVINKFGSDIKLDDAKIDRKKLGHIVFNNKKKRKILERIVHEQVLRDVQSKIREYISDKKPLVFIDIPLLFEVKWEFLVDETWVVYCDEIEQLDRIQRRDDLSIEEAKSRISAQIPIDEKKEMGDIVIDSSVSYEKMYKQVDYELERLNKKK